MFPDRQILWTAIFFNSINLFLVNRNTLRKLIIKSQEMKEKTNKKYLKIHRVVNFLYCQYTDTDSLTERKIFFIRATNSTKFPELKNFTYATNNQGYTCNINLIMTTLFITLLSSITIFSHRTIHSLLVSVSFLDWQLCIQIFCIIFMCFSWSTQSRSIFRT